MDYRKAAVLIAFFLVVTAGSVGWAAVTDPCFGRTPTILGTDGPDRIRGTNGADVISTGDGHDRIDALGGADRVCAGPGNDVVDGGPGDDVLFGSVGVDRLAGRDGHDELYSGGSYGTERERLIGGAHDDDLHGESTPEDLRGGLGEDTIQGGSSLLTVPDLAFGGPDDDRLISPVAMLRGGQGSDYLAEGTADYSAALGPVTVDLGRQTAEGEGSDQVVDVKGVIGSAYDDVLIGNHRSTRLAGGEGDDLLDGREGNDTLDGGPGTDACVQGNETFLSCESIGAREAVALQPGAMGAEPRPGVTDDGSPPTWPFAGAAALAAAVALLAYKMGARRAARPAP